MTKPSRAILAEAAEMAATQGVPMLGLRIALSEAQLDRRLGAPDTAARRLGLALSSMPENDGSADLLAAHQLAGEIQLEAGAIWR